MLSPNAMEVRHGHGSVARTAVATVGAILILTVAAPAATASPSVAISFDAITTTSSWQRGQGIGTFALTGTAADSGSARIAYRLLGQRMRATATLIGANGILTIGLRAVLTPPIDGRQAAAGRWRTCGGTGRYRRLIAEGSWNAVVDVVAGPGGLVPRALHGASYGSVRRYPPRRRPGSAPSDVSWC
jgi:hypothetical protein